MSSMGEREQFFDGPLADGLPSIVAAAHELKSPLALMRQLSLMLESESNTESERQRMLRQISLTSERALRLTSDLTKSVRLSDAMFELEPINPCQVCEDTIHEMMPLFNAHNVKIKLSNRRHSYLLVANRDLLKRIIMNFSDNALQYADENSQIEIKVSACRGGKSIRLGVRDYGPAVPKCALKMIKNDLKFAPAPVHARPQSSGLGIYIASQFAAAMNGEIGITRHRDGATFYVDLQASNQLSLL